MWLLPKLKNEDTGHRKMALVLMAGNRLGLRTLGARFRSLSPEPCTALPLAVLGSGVDLRMRQGPVHLKRQKATNSVRCWFFQYVSRRKILAYVPSSCRLTKLTQLLTEQGFPEAGAASEGPSLILSGGRGWETYGSIRIQSISQLVGP